MTEKVEYDSAAIVDGLEHLLTISTKKPNQRIDSPMVADGLVPDSWYRKGKFSTALTYMEMLAYMGLIQDEALKKRIKAFRELQLSDDFKHSNDTTEEQVNIAYQLVTDVVNHLKK